MGFCPPFRYLSDGMKCTQVAEIKSSVLLFKLYLVKNWWKNSVPNDKKFGAYNQRLLTIKDISGMNLRTSPQLLDKSCQYGKEDFKNKIMS